MSGKYIDFIPTKKRSDQKVVTSVRTMVTEQVQEVRQVQMPISKAQVGQGARAAIVSRNSQTLGVTEDLSARFVKTEVPKRPLSGATASAMRGVNCGVDPAARRGMTDTRGDVVVSEGANSELRNLKAKKVGQRARKVAKVIETEAEVEKTQNDRRAVYSVPKSPFINQANLPKRPLSKNVYHGQFEPLMGNLKPSDSREDVKTKVISQAPKESKVEPIIGVIVTIILGAVAGTVAFLLLPK